jgi:hypothetical protein
MLVTCPPTLGRSGRESAAEVDCLVWGRRVTVRGPPPQGFKDPWAGSPDNRISPHWSNPMKEAKAGN